MRLVDVNVLLYAVNADAPRHETSHRWLEGALRGSETILLPWLNMIAFTRLATHPRLLPAPLPVHDAFDLVDGWLTRPCVTVPTPDHRHPQRLRELLTVAGGTGGNLVNDAHQAALALQYDAVVETFDSDFGRFPGVHWETPPASSPA